jgi:hypothetical protein
VAQDLELFLDVISSRVPAEAHSAQMLLLDQLRNAFAVADRQLNSGLVKGEVKRSGVGGVVRSVFPNLTDKEVALLLATLDKDVPSGAEAPVKCDGLPRRPALSPPHRPLRHPPQRPPPLPFHRYVELFQEDKDFNQSAFVEKARGLCLRAPREYVNTIETAMKEADVAGSGLVAWPAAAAAIVAVDPQIPLPHVDEMMRVGFGEVHADELVDVRIFCRRLLFSYPRRYGPPPKLTLHASPSSPNAKSPKLRSSKLAGKAAQAAR